MIGGDAPEGVAGTDLGNGALVAIEATIVAHLQKKGAITKPVATFDTFGAADAKLFVDGVFVVGIFDEAAFNRRSGAKAILSTGVQVVRLRLEIARTELAIAANRVSVHTFHRGLLEHTMRRAVCATNTFLGIDLPYGPLGRAWSCEQTDQAARPGYGGQARAVSQEFPPRYLGSLGWLRAHWLALVKSAFGAHDAHLPADKV